MAASQAIICEEPCEFEFRDGLVYVSDSLGIVRAFRLHTFSANFHRAAQCMQECHSRRGAEVIPFPEREIGAH